MLAKRLIYGLASLFLVSLLLFALGFYSSGSVVFATNLQGVGAALKESFEANLNLDQSFWAQYIAWLKNALRLDFGNSLLSGQSVTSLVLPPFFNTLLLVSLSLILLFATALVICLASFKFAFLSAVVEWLCVSFFALPSFALALLVLLVFGIYFEIESNLVLALLSMLLGHLVLFIRVFNASSKTTLNSTFITASFARGLSKARVYGFILPLHSLHTLLTYTASNLAGFLSSAYGVEVVLAYEGMGKLSLDAVLFKDYPVVIFIGLCSVVSVFLINVAAELLLGFLNKRQANA